MHNKLLQEQAMFNQKGDALTTKLLASLSKEELTKERGSYFKNLESLYSHLVGGEILLVNTIAAVLPRFKIEAGEVGEFEFSVASKKSEAIASLIVKLAKEVTAEELEVNVDFYGYQVPVGTMFIKIFTHSSHHRGQISQILDEMKIEHDLIRMTPL